MKVFCNKCGRELTWKDRISIVSLEPTYEQGGVSGTRCKTIDRINLCKCCYKKYEALVLNFLV